MYRTMPNNVWCLDLPGGKEDSAGFCRMAVGTVGWHRY